MIRIQKKSEQYNKIILDGKFITNKPIVNGFKDEVAPYSNIFYWSNGVALDDCEFGLHPHEGFEIMTFIIEGEVAHYDTATKVWTPLKTGDFQVIQSNKGLQHRERITKGTRNFQIWFDPNFYEALKLTPNYIDYHSKDFQPKVENEISTLTFIGKGSAAKVLTQNLTIKKLTFDKQTKKEIALNESMSYTFYVLSGKGFADHQSIEKDDAIRISNATTLEIDFEGELFYIETPTKLDYIAVWTA